MSGMNSLPLSPVRQFQLSRQVQVNKSYSSDRTPKTVPAEPFASTTHHISPFSQALSDVAIIAAKRDASTSRYELAKIALATSAKLYGDSYQKNKAAYDVELPTPDDPQHVAQARQVTDYTNGKGNNPFEGMPPDQLALIIYDESGTFTTNERRAASKESNSQREAWEIAVCAKLMDEYHRTRKISSGLYQEISDHYRALPPIEESQLLEGYDTDLQALIDTTEPDPFQNNENWSRHSTQ